MIIEIWVPPESKRIRAILLIPNNTDSYLIGEHPAVRKMAAKHDLAIIHLKNFIGQVIEYLPAEGPTVADESFQVLLEQAAQQTGMEDFKYAPWITLGKSSRGRFPYHTAWWFPGRVIATISYHGEGPFPRASWAKSPEHESILHCSVNGLTEWDGTWFQVYGQISSTIKASMAGWDIKPSSWVSTTAITQTIIFIPPSAIPCHKKCRALFA